MTLEEMQLYFDSAKVTVDSTTLAIAQRLGLDRASSLRYHELDLC